MGHLLSSFVRLVRVYFLLFVAIATILACGPWLRTEWREVRELVAELPSLQQAQTNVQAYTETITKTITREAEALSTSALDRVDTQIRFIDSELLRLQAARDNLSPWSTRGAGKSLPERLENAARHAAETELRVQEKRYLTDLRIRLEAVAHRDAALKKYELLRRAYLVAHAAHVRAYDDWASADNKLTVFDRALCRFSSACQHAADLKHVVDVQRTATAAALERFRVQKRAVELIPQPLNVAHFRVDKRQLAATAAPLIERLDRAQTLAAQSLGWRLYQALEPVLLPAAGVLASWLLLPLAIRAAFYYLFAPLAARARPVVLQQQADDVRVLRVRKRTAAGELLNSAVSQRVVLGPNDEMLIRPTYCQSLSGEAEVGTRWLFDWVHWLPSIAAHLWMLERITSARSCDVVVSSTVDPLEEVALLDIAAGEAFVLQARALVGAYYQRGQRPKIRSHWRLGTLHAWLTLQVRYLSFEGPATLIVKGCRGVRLEHAGDGRTISQDATLGFSANTSYATVRAKPFVPYVRGQRALLNDKFTGSSSYFLYEEIPSRRRPGHANRNPLEALVDAGLKAFGI